MLSQFYFRGLSHRDFFNNFPWQWQLGNAQMLSNKLSLLPVAPEGDPESASLGLHDWKVINIATTAAMIKQ